MPQTLPHSDSTSSFKAALKTHLFKRLFLNSFSQPCPSPRPTLCQCVCVCVCVRVRARARARACMRSCVRVCVCVCVVSVIVKRPVLPPSVVDGRSRNPLYYYYYLAFYWGLNGISWFSSSLQVTVMQIVTLCALIWAFSSGLTMGSLLE